MKTRLLRRNEAAEGTMSFYFEKPIGFKYSAGQYCDWSLINPPETDDEGNTRTFSLASAPYQPELMITTRMRNSAFKNVLKSMPLESEIEVEGPFGSLTLHQDITKPAVFIAGGIGITPFHSIILEAAHEKLSQDLYLFYSNRRPQDAAFLDELQKLEETYPSFALIPTMTEIDNSIQPWEDEKGLINDAMIQRYIKNLQLPIYYIAGPPKMVRAMNLMLNNLGIPNDSIRTELFSGY